MKLKNLILGSMMAALVLANSAGATAVDTVDSLIEKITQELAVKNITFSISDEAIGKRSVALWLKQFDSMVVPELLKRSSAYPEVKITNYSLSFGFEDKPGISLSSDRNVMCVVKLLQKLDQLIDLEKTTHKRVIYDLGEFTAVNLKTDDRGDYRCNEGELYSVSKQIDLIASKSDQYLKLGNSIRFLNFTTGYSYSEGLSFSEDSAAEPNGRLIIRPIRNENFSQTLDYAVAAITDYEFTRTELKNQGVDLKVKLLFQSQYEIPREGVEISDSKSRLNELSARFAEAREIAPFLKAVRPADQVSLILKPNGGVHFWRKENKTESALEIAPKGITDRNDQDTLSFLKDLALESDLSLELGIPIGNFANAPWYSRSPYQPYSAFLARIEAHKELIRTKINSIHEIYFASQIAYGRNKLFVNSYAGKYYDQQLEELLKSLP